MKSVFFGLIYFSLSLMVNAQTSNEILSLKLRPAVKTQILYAKDARQENEEVDIVSGWMFRFYKKYISSQDYGNCSFIPSCSEYAIIAIHQQGLFIGIVNTIDRLTRCNGRNSRNYPVDPESGLLIDEVRDHNYE
jgi:putative component of membrane protein insertase Oxa1/YidC/SpoIIIJ protein YidD